MVEITHTRADGTTADGTAKGDGSAPILKRAGFRWAPSIKTWIIQQSRDREAKTWIINAAAEGLRAAGFEVTVSIDDTPRDFATAEAERADRIADRADRLETRAERAAAESEARLTAARQAFDAMNGQPILVGHYSEGPHRRAIARANNNMHRGIEEGRRAEQLERAARVAGDYTARRESLPTTLRRIAKLEAEERKTRRDVQPCPTSGKRGKPEKVVPGRTITCPVCYHEVTFGSDLRVEEHGRRISQATADQRLAELADELAYWRKVVADQQDDGAKVWGPNDFKPGDRVLSWAGWREVLKVNAKSLTVPSGYSWNDRIRYDDVTDRRPAEEAGQVVHVDVDADDGPTDGGCE
jgi:hypothetical protein